MPQVAHGVADAARLPASRLPRLNERVRNMGVFPRFRHRSIRRESPALALRADKYVIILLFFWEVRNAFPDWTIERCKAIVGRNLRNFKDDDTVAEVCAHARVPLFVFHLGLLRASAEIGERPFPFFDGC